MYVLLFSTSQYDAESLLRSHSFAVKVMQVWCSVSQSILRYPFKIVTYKFSVDFGMNSLSYSLFALNALHQHGDTGDNVTFIIGEMP